MSNRTRTGAAFLLAIGTLGVAPLALADPCTIVEGPYGNYQVDPDCTLLDEAFAELAESVELRTEPRIRLSLPDLVAVDGNIKAAFGSQDLVELQVKVANRGTKDAPAFQVRGVFQAFRGAQMVVQDTQTVSFSGGLAAGADQRLYFPAAVNYQWDGLDRLQLTLFVDDGGPGVSAGGEIWESTELNNIGRETCLVLDPQEICHDEDIEYLSP
ncbi:MAG: hypothetical protein AAGI15_14730 [Pseudomonadota bacterium]